MFRRSVMLIACVVAVLGGCASTPRATVEPPSEDPLVLAHSALAGGDTRTARAILGHPPANAEDATALDTVYVLLLGEVALIDGDPAMAGRMAEIVLARRAGDSRGLEMAGKAALRQGDFDAALQHFNSAAGGVRAPADRQRLADLGHLAGGLRAYTRGDMAQARDRLGQVRDPALRLEINRAYAAVVSPESR